MPEPHDPYPVEPQPERPAPPAEPIPVAQERKARIEAEPLLNDFSEDADFDKDPELERAILGPAAAAAKLNTEPGPERPEFVKPGFGEPQYWAMFAAGLLVLAMIATGINAPNRTVFRILLTAYNVLVHTGTGVVAVYLTSKLLEHRFGRVEPAAARMFTAVAAMALVLTLNLAITPYNWINLTVRLVIAVAVYVGIVAATFKLWKKTPLMYVVGLHALLWLIVQVGMALAEAVGRAPAVAAVPTGG